MAQYLGPQYDRVKSAVVAADGTATISIAPTQQDEIWVVLIVAITCTAAPAGAVVRLYRGDADTGTLISWTPAADLDTAPDLAIEVTAGRPITAKWTGETPGATCTMTAVISILKG